MSFQYFPDVLEIVLVWSFLKLLLHGSVIRLRSLISEYLQDGLPNRVIFHMLYTGNQALCLLVYYMQVWCSDDNNMQSLVSVAFRSYATNTDEMSTLLICCPLSYWQSRLSLLNILIGQKMEHFECKLDPEGVASRLIWFYIIQSLSELPNCPKMLKKRGGSLSNFHN